MILHSPLALSFAFDFQASFMSALRANLGHLPTVQVVHAAITNHSEAMRQHATCNVHNTSGNMRRCNLQPAVCSIKKHAPCGVQHKESP